VVRHPHEGESRRPLAARLRVELEYPGRRGRFSLELSADFPPAASSKRAKETPQKSLASLLDPNLLILRGVDVRVRWRVEVLKRHITLFHKKLLPQSVDFRLRKRMALSSCRSLTRQDKHCQQHDPR